jgi:hypothetical protein
MTWTYSIAIMTPKDEVRFYVADTDPVDPLVQDEEIAFVLSFEPDTRLAAAAVARQIAMQFAKQVTMEIAQEVRINLSDRAKNYMAMAKELDEAAHVGTGGGGLVGAYSGGISVADKATTAANADRVIPSFTKHLMQTRAERAGTALEDDG